MYNGVYKGYNPAHYFFISSDTPRLNDITPMT